MVSSPALLQELERTLAAQFSLTPPAKRFLRELTRDVRLVAEALPAAVCRDPDDDVMLATALAAGADAIVTGDQDLLVSGEYEDIALLTPRQLLERIEGETTR